MLVQVAHFMSLFKFLFDLDFVFLSQSMFFNILIHVVNRYNFIEIKLLIKLFIMSEMCF